MSDDSPPTSRLSSIEKLKLKRDQIDAQIKLKQARLQQQARKDDTRRKIIAGALALEHAILNPDTEFGKKLFRLLDEYVITDRERALFDMAPLPKQNANDDQAPGLKGKFPA